MEVGQEVTVDEVDEWVAQYTTRQTQAEEDALMLRWQAMPVDDQIRAFEKVERWAWARSILLTQAEPRPCTRGRRRR